MADAVQLGWGVVDSAGTAVLSPVCVICGDVLPAGSRRERMYCSTACASRAQNARPGRKAQKRRHNAEWRARVRGAERQSPAAFDCAHCGRACRPGVDVDGRASKFCGKACKASWRRGRPKAVRETVVEFDCAHCGKACRPGVNVGRRASKFCGEACKAAAQNAKMRDGARWRIAERKLRRFAVGFGPDHVFVSYVRTKCPECGDRFSLVDFSDQKMYCSPRCTSRHHVRKSGHKRRQLINSRPVDDISRSALFERDGFGCYLCGDDIDPAVDANTREQPTMDHIVPVTLGGSHTWGNVAMAHRGCNSSKGNRLPAAIVAVVDCMCRWLTTGRPERGRHGRHGSCAEAGAAAS